MTTDDLQRFADDLRSVKGLNVDLHLTHAPDGMHVLTVNGWDFFFGVDGGLIANYDGWGRPLMELEPPKGKN